MLKITFNFDQKIIGEMEIRHETLPLQYDTNAFLRQLEESKDHFEFVKVILVMSKKMADENQLTWETNGDLVNIQWNIVFSPSRRGFFSI